MSKGEAKCAVSPHGNSSNRSCLALTTNAVGGFDVRNEFLQKEIVVANFTVRGVYVKAGLRVGCDDQKITDLVLLAEIFDQVPSTAFEQSLLVLAKPVQKIQHCVMLTRMVCGRGVVTGWKQHAVVNGFSEDATFQGIAIDAALRRCRDGKQQ